MASSNLYGPWGPGGQITCWAPAVCQDGKGSLAVWLFQLCLTPGLIAAWEESLPLTQGS